jgi:hypothetical protein
MLGWREFVVVASDSGSPASVLPPPLTSSVPTFGILARSSEDDGGGGIALNAKLAAIAPGPEAMMRCIRISSLRVTGWGSWLGSAAAEQIEAEVKAKVLVHQMGKTAWKR